MRKLIFICAALCLSVVAKSQTWTLEWSDEFNGTSLNQANWSFETGTGVNGDFGTGQLDRATDRPENVAIEQGIAGADGGALRISTRKEFYIDRNYTSGRINTASKQGFGPNHRIVARVWPKGVRTMGQGFAFWMMPNEVPAGQSTISWPQGGEIDIMEYVGSIPNYNLGTVHYAWAWNNNQYADWNHGSQGGYYSLADTQAPDSPEWIRVDLGALFNVDHVNINWENTGKTFQIQTSTDGTTWSTAYSTTAGTGGIQDITFSARSARFVRMYGTQRSNDWGYSIYEFAVYAGSTTNIALNKAAIASSSQGTDVAPNFAFDGSTTTRWGSNVRNPQYQCCDQASSTDATVASNGWHTYGIDWYADRIEFFVDYNVYHIHYLNDGAAFALDGQNQAEVQIVNGRKVRKSEYSNLYPEWHPFEHKMYAILSAGVGGGGNTYGGPIVDQAIFPADVYVDWVRVYNNGITYNPPPQATLTSPTGIETYAAPGNITLTASASDRDGGTIASVSFYNGTTLLGTDNTAPYNYNWTNVPAGNYTVHAVATDNGGATGASNNVNVAVNGPSSNLALNRPGTASSVTGSSVASNAFDADGTTRWESAYADPQWIYADLGNTYNINHVKITWETAFGKDYQIQTSTDATNWTTIKSVTGNTTLVNDWTGLTGSGRYLRIYGTARATTYGYSIFTVEAYGSGGATNVAPTVSITSPVNNATFTPPATINIAANASDSDGTISKVDFYSGATLLNTDTSSPYSFSWTNVPAGIYSLTAVATDNGGKATTSAIVTVTVGTTSGSNLALNRPATASSVTGGNIAAAAVDGVATTRWESASSDPQWIYVDLGTTNTISRVKITWENAYGKDYQIQTSADAATWTTIKTVTGNTALVNDNTGLSGSGRYVRVYGTARGTGYGYSIFELEVYGDGSSNVAPSVGITSPANNATFTAPASVTINANASDTDGTISKVDFYNGATLLGTDTSSPYSYSWTGVAAGNYTITAKATDNGGASTTSTGVTIVVSSVSSSNLAQGKPATASSVIGANTAAAAVDGVATTRWESAASDPQWIYVDLGTATTIGRLKITWENAYGKDYQIQTSADAATWTTIKTVTGNTTLVNDNTGLSGSGRYVRIYGTARGTGYGYSIYELEVYSSSGSNGLTVPGTIQAESFAAMSGIQTETTSDTGGGQDIGWIDANDWMDYAVTVSATGTYNVQFRLAGWAAGAQLQLKNGSTILATVNVPNTGGGQVWATTTAVSVPLTAGAQTLRVLVVTGGFNFNWMSFVSAGGRMSQTQDEQPSIYPNPVESVLYIKGVEEGAPVGILDMSGRAVLNTKVQSSSVDMGGLNSGFYILHIQSKERIIKMKVSKK